MHILSIGSALIDVFIKSNQFQKDEAGVVRIGDESGKMDVESFTLKTGGGGGNTAVGFKRQGFETSVIAETGQDELAQLVVSELEQERVDTVLMVYERREETGGAVILVGENGFRSVMVHRGAASMLDPHDIDFDRIGSVDWMHVSSMSGRGKTLEHIFDQVKERQIKISWNPGSGDLKLIAAGELDVNKVDAEILLLNKEEWQMVEAQQPRLRELISQIVVTDGSQGGQVLLRDGEDFDYEAQAVEAIDNTGAGDAFIVGYVSAVLRGGDARQATAWGVKNSASVVQFMGAKQGLLKQSEL